MSAIDLDAYGWGLIERTRLGEAEAFGEFYDRYFSEVYSYVFGLVRNRRTAEDLTGDAFFRALRAVRTVRPELNSPRRWLATVARHTVREYYRTSAQVRAQHGGPAR